MFKISVVVPTRKRPQLLARCLAQLRPGVQSLHPSRFEVIVTDDSDDEETSLLVTSRYPWARYTRGPRRGPAANRNHGAAHAVGEWLAFTDDDCVPEHSWLEEFASSVERSTAEKAFVLEGKTTCVAGVRSPLEHSPINLVGGFLWSCNLMVRKALFLAIQGFDEKFPHPHMEDVDFRERLRRCNVPMTFVAGAVVDHPPRYVDFGYRLAKHQESSVYYWYKSGNRKRSEFPILIALVRTRLRSLKRGYLGERLVALASLCCEIATLVVLLPLWDTKYRRGADNFQHQQNAGAEWLRNGSRELTFWT